MNLASLFLLAALQASGTTPGEIRSHATLHSIGIEWDLEGDADHDASCRVAFRPRGASEWKNAMPLFRVDFSGWYGDTVAERPYNMLAGSILFLAPGTSYEVKLELADPDGGAASKTISIETRPVPSLGADARLRHVVPTSGDGGGGEGTKGDPFRGLRAAQTAAAPGDVFLLGAGEYGTFSFDAPGEPGRYIAWKGTGDPVLTSAGVAGSHIWIEGLTFRMADRDGGVKARGAARDRRTPAR